MSTMDKWHGDRSHTELDLRQWEGCLTWGPKSGHTNPNPMEDKMSERMGDHGRVIDEVSGVTVGKKGGVLLPYDEDRLCPKCGHSNTEDTYLPDEDLIHRGCCRCHHGWRELPLDR